MPKSLTGHLHPPPPSKATSPTRLLTSPTALPSHAASLEMHSGQVPRARNPRPLFPSRHATGPALLRTDRFQPLEGEVHPVSVG